MTILHEYMHFTLEVTYMQLLRLSDDHSWSWDQKAADLASYACTLSKNSLVIHVYGQNHNLLIQVTLQHSNLSELAGMELVTWTHTLCLSSHACTFAISTEVLVCNIMAMGTIWAGERFHCLLLIHPISILGEWKSALSFWGQHTGLSTVFKVSI